ncbi:MAG: MEDS domain-containing protein, partial [Actinobacteria bacterium]|nr:MEDS domain-containing protein [Actinomycetota bacterium]
MNLTTRSRPSAGGGRPPAVPDAADHHHLVEFYNGEEFLAGAVAGFLGPALNEDDAAVVVATAAHRTAFDVALRRLGVDLAGAVANGQYLSFDAGELLECFMVGGAPNAERFAAMAGGLIERAGVGGRRVRIYGEMVALLWDAGDVLSAVALEDLWNDL